MLSALSGCATVPERPVNERPQENPRISHVRESLQTALKALLHSSAGTLQTEEDGAECFYPKGSPEPTLCQDETGITLSYPLPATSHPKFLEVFVPKDGRISVGVSEKDTDCKGDCPEEGERFPLWQCGRIEDIQSTPNGWKCTYYPRSEEKGISPADPFSFLITDTAIICFLQGVGILLKGNGSSGKCGFLISEIQVANH